MILIRPFDHSTKCAGQCGTFFFAFNPFASPLVIEPCASLAPLALIVTLSKKKPPDLHHGGRSGGSKCELRVVSGDFAPPTQNAHLDLVGLGATAATAARTMRLWKEIHLKTHDFAHNL